MEQHRVEVEPERADARAAGLRYVSDSGPGIRRFAAGKGFGYRLPNGKLVRDKSDLKRIRALAIPPAWTDVWICAYANGHIQATGRDDRGRKQYRYHDDWRAVRDRNKYERLIEFARTLPAIRERVARDMSRRAMDREKVVATVVSLLDKSLIRIGNEEYARQNDSFGLTTLRNRHIEVDGSEVRFRFKGKSGKVWRLSIKDRRIARVVRSIQELPGQPLFQYLDEDGSVQSVDSADVNDYLRGITGADVSAKDFRTWAGTVLAAMALGAVGPFGSQTEARANVKRAIEAVGSKLGNTVAVCRKCNVHPDVVTAYLEGRLPEVGAGPMPAGAGLPSEEKAVLRLLERRRPRRARLSKPQPEPDRRPA